MGPLERISGLQWRHERETKQHRRGNLSTKHSMIRENLIICVSNWANWPPASSLRALSVKIFCENTRLIENILGVNLFERKAEMLCSLFKILTKRRGVSSPGGTCGPDVQLCSTWFEVELHMEWRQSFANKPYSSLLSRACKTLCCECVSEKQAISASKGFWRTRFVFTWKNKHTK